MTGLRCIHTHACTHTHTHTHNGILLSYKKEWNIAICSNMDGPRDYRTKWSKSEKDKYVITYMWNLKNNTNESVCAKQKYTHRHRKQTYDYQG